MYTHVQGCGYHIYNHVTTERMYSLGAKSLEKQVPFQPEYHLFYQDAAAASRERFDNDPLPKLLDFPT